MQKTCICGHGMKLKLRTVIYTKLVEIDNVPIYSCGLCDHNEVIPEVKNGLSEFIQQLSPRPYKQTYLFNECNEWARIIFEIKQIVKSVPISRAQMEQTVQERTNELLDLYLLAQSLNDREWEKSIERRLFQLGPQLK